MVFAHTIQQADNALGTQIPGTPNGTVVLNNAIIAPVGAPSLAMTNGNFYNNYTGNTTAGLIINDPSPFTTIEITQQFPAGDTLLHNGQVVTRTVLYENIRMVLGLAVPLTINNNAFIGLTKDGSDFIHLTYVSADSDSTHAVFDYHGTTDTATPGTLGFQTWNVGGTDYTIVHGIMNLNPSNTGINNHYFLPPNVSLLGLNDAPVVISSVITNTTSGSPNLQTGDVLQLDVTFNYPVYGVGPGAPGLGGPDTQVYFHRNSPWSESWHYLSCAANDWTGHGNRDGFRLTCTILSSDHADAGKIWLVNDQDTYPPPPNPTYHLWNSSVWAIGASGVGQLNADMLLNNTISGHQVMTDISSWSVNMPPLVTGLVKSIPSAHLVTGDTVNIWLTTNTPVAVGSPLPYIEFTIGGNTRQIIPDIGDPWGIYGSGHSGIAFSYTIQNSDVCTAGNASISTTLSNVSSITLYNEHSVVMTNSTIDSVNVNWLAVN